MHKALPRKRYGPGQLIAMLAAQDAALAERAGELEERLARLERAASRNPGQQPGAPRTLAAAAKIVEALGLAEVGPNS